MSDEDDIFSRPSEFRQSTILEVWDKAKPVKGKPDHRYDWRNGTLIGPWKEGESRAGVWDCGHIEPWYKVVDKLKKVDGITREMVLDEFNDIDNLGVEDPEANRKLGVNSRVLGVDRLPYDQEEEALFEDVHEGEKEQLRGQFRAQIDKKSQGVKERLENYRMKGENMSEAENEEQFSQPKRVIVWDTETTGFSPKSGDKLVEIGAIEMIDGKATGKEYHQYINPERHIPSRASDVHGITDEDVKDSPVFKDIAEDFLKFVGDAPLVAHNANFDMRFINAELKENGYDEIGDERKIDTLKLAKKLLPDMEQHDLDTLAEHFDVDTSGRDDHHGGLIDTIILADVYKGLVGLAKEQNVSILEEISPTSSYAPVDNDQEFSKAVEAEQMLQQQWRAKHAKKGIDMDGAPTDRSDGFAGKIRAAEAEKAASKENGKGFGLV